MYCILDETMDVTFKQTPYITLLSYYNVRDFSYAALTVVKLILFFSLKRPLNLETVIGSYDLMLCSRGYETFITMSGVMKIFNVFIV